MSFATVRPVIIQTKNNQQWTIGLFIQGLIDNQWNLSFIILKAILVFGGRTNLQKGTENIQ